MVAPFISIPTATIDSNLLPSYADDGSIMPEHKASQSMTNVESSVGTGSTNIDDMASSLRTLAEDELCRADDSSSQSLVARDNYLVRDEPSSFDIVRSGIQNLNACHAETWPTSLTVTLQEQPAVSIRDLQVGLKHFEPVLCTFEADPRANNPVHNGMAYNALVTQLMTKNFYFVASWTLSNGNVLNNLLIFRVQNAGLVGAFFPLNGIPEMPREVPHVPPSRIISNRTLHNPSSANPNHGAQATTTLGETTHI
ncbi:hypothetical protein C8R44DRAFT_873041 [Mycena epipterygia]|nr:hypothetical protein C8R44DRAFT_873041 [Mycena epipterygia]